jgi:hypothetical protein
MLEIDVDVGRLAAVFGNEAREQQAVLGGIDRRHAQAEADRGIGRRSPPLAEDAHAPRLADDVVHGDEIVGIVHLLDQPQLFGELRRRPWADTPPG